jgi:tRNA(Ile)-lysidine synthase
LQTPGVLLDRVADFMRGFGSAPGVVAVSGGPDSVALLHLLVTLRRQGKVGELTVAHLNHQLRGQESDGDEAFVRELAKRINGGPLPCLTKSANVANLARVQGGNLENLGRQLRYDWFAEVARAQSAAWVATGHTADDQAETVLHRLLRGTGLHGLGGIPARRELIAGIQVIRPLLRIRRTDVMTYLEEQKLSFRQDSSNSRLDFTRNRIRRELLPHLAEHYNPGIVDVLCRLADQARETQQQAEHAAATLLAQASLPRAGALFVFDLQQLGRASRHEVREMFRLVWQQERWPQGDMSFDQWDRLAALVFGGPAALDLPGRIHARRQGRILQLGVL